jgi:hypothetical protein
MSTYTVDENCPINVFDVNELHYKVHVHMSILCKWFIIGQQSQLQEQMAVQSTRQRNTQAVKGGI